jgi:hypothetical protein
MITQKDIASNENNSITLEVGHQEDIINNLFEQFNQLESKLINYLRDPDLTEKSAGLPKYNKIIDKVSFNNTRLKELDQCIYDIT